MALRLGNIDVRLGIRLAGLALVVTAVAGRPAGQSAPIRDLWLYQADTAALLRLTIPSHVECDSRCTSRKLLVRKMTDEEDDSLTLRVSKAEALVIFELLSREAEADAESLQIVHPAEIHALWRIEAQLEKSLVEMFRPDYQEIINNARESLTNDPRIG